MRKSRTSRNALSPNIVPGNSIGSQNGRMATRSTIAIGENMYLSIARLLPHCG